MSVSENIEKMSPRRRRNALAVLMLAVLLAGTAFAWVITLTRSADRPGESWYLLTNEAGQPIGWQVVQRKVGEKGESDGYTVSIFHGTSAITWSRWTLDAEAESGRYSSAVEGIGERGQLGTRRFTQIVYDNPALTVKLIGPRGRGVSVSFTVADDYIPEGRLRSAIVRAAKKGKSSRHMVVVDSLARPVPLTLEPGDRQERTIGGRKLDLIPVTVRWETKKMSKQETRYFVADGKIQLVEQLDSGKIDYAATLVDVEDVRARYPRAHWLRTRILQDAESR